MLRIIDCATEEGLIILTHAGMDIGIYDRNYCSVAHILHVIDEVHPEKFVLAHMGNWDCWQEVERDLAGAPVWLDTAFSIGPITKNPATEESPYEEMNLRDEDFIRLCRKHGTNRILFATDSPWQDQADYISRITTPRHLPTRKKNTFSQEMPWHCWEKMLSGSKYCKYDDHSQDGCIHRPIPFQKSGLRHRQAPDRYKPLH